MHGTTAHGDMIGLKRVYEPAAADDGLRVLVDRLWARGLSKPAAHLDAWMKELGPSDELRRWFGHRPERWEGFQQRYRDELRSPLRSLFLALLQSTMRVSKVTLVYGARDTQENEAVVLRDCLLSREAGPGPNDPRLFALAAVAAVAAAQPDGEASEDRLAPFVRSLLSPSQLESALQGLCAEGDLRRGQCGWLISSRGKSALQDMSRASDS
jgi:uncharacterized protein YeaO (DUF488 family)